ncbi:MAG: hypothetical protein K1X57_13800 [Gemmataceae bacterium]|nr:hypothetical protein [Gemmataceae bacterium]
MNDELLAELDGVWSDQGPDAAIAQAITLLTAAGDATGLFYALLLQARRRLGVDPVPTRPTSELPESVLDEYEVAIREAAQAAGRLCLARQDPLSAWGYYRLIQEPGPVREFLEGWSPPEEDDPGPFLDLAMQQNVAPLWGLKLILKQQGVCTALSAFAACAAGWPAADRTAGTGLLVAAVHEQLTGALADTAGVAPAPIPELLARHPELMGEDGYYIDLSHLAAVVQLSLDVDDAATVAKARELCEFGRRLPERFAFSGARPWATYEDFAAWFAAREGDEAAVARFREYAAGGGECTETYVNLLRRLGRHGEAVAVAREHFLHEDDRSLRCPGLYELANADPKTLSDIARDRGDAVHYLAARLRLQEKESRSGG